MHFLDSFKTMWDHWSYYENKSSLLCTCANPDSYIHLCPCPFSFDSPELPFQLPLSSGSPQMSLACRPLPTAHPMGIYPEHPPPSLLWPALMYYEHCSLSSQIARVISHSMCPKHSRQTWSLVDAQKKKKRSQQSPCQATTDSHPTFMICSSAGKLLPGYGGHFPSSFAAHWVLPKSLYKENWKEAEAC